MKKTVDLVLTPEEAFDELKCQEVIRNRLRVSPNEEEDIVIRVLKRSIDARRSPVKIQVRAVAYSKDEVLPTITYQKDFPNVSSAKPVIIVGAGPAGLFAALRLIEQGQRPIILERGKDVQTRRRDLAAINKEQIVNPNSNYCFGEGGAGTYSDGKLYTRSKKRGNVMRVLEILVAHGAPEDILIDAHPHIGTNKLPKVVAEIRNSILGAGGLIHFNTKITDLVIDQGRLQGVVSEEGEEFMGLGVILATGHSARDVFKMLHEKDVHMEAKPFALGVRIEHAQSLIDTIQYHCADRGSLPAASYSLTHQSSEGPHRGSVFSFCMCPGGFIVPAATAPGELVVNGMSPSRRDSRFANSGMVVAVNWDDFQEFHQYGPLAGMYYQQAIEQQACALTGGGQVAPAQRMVDFVNKTVSTHLLETSYQPGLASVDLDCVLPLRVSQHLRDALKRFGKKMKGYFTNEAQIVGVESRTSSPITIPRNPGSLEHVQLKGLFPCGEGAGYAGGIVSAALDGIKCAEALVQARK